MCKPYIHKYRRVPGVYQTNHPSLKCVAEGTPDPSGNDGKCREPGNLDTTAYADRLANFFDTTAIVLHAQSNEERDVRTDILQKYPEADCLYGNLTNARNIQTGDVLENGECGLGYLCYQDYNDEKGIYDYWCDFLENPPKLNFACLESKDGVRYGRCEEKHLDMELAKAFEGMATHSRLGRGQPCQYDLEEDIRQWIREGKASGSRNRYKMLLTLQTEKYGRDEFCDRSRLLECTRWNTCECLKNTEPRKVEFEGTEYESDYCYLARGRCDQSLEDLGTFTQSELEKIWMHYGQPDSSCELGNVCVYLNDYGKFCTTINTGKTGHDLKPIPTEKPTTTTPKSKPELEPGHGFAGGERRLGINGVTACMLLAVRLLINHKQSIINELF